MRRQARALSLGERSQPREASTSTLGMAFGAIATSPSSRYERPTSAAQSHMPTLMNFILAGQRRQGTSSSE